MTSLISGSPRRETWTQSPNVKSSPLSRSTVVRCRLALAYTPITAFESLASFGFL